MKASMMGGQSGMMHMKAPARPVVNAVSAPATTLPAEQSTLHPNPVHEIVQGSAPTAVALPSVPQSPHEEPSTSNPVSNGTMTTLAATDAINIPLVSPRIEALGLPAPPEQPSLIPKDHLSSVSEAVVPSAIDDVEIGTPLTEMIPPVTLIQSTNTTEDARPDHSPSPTLSETSSGILVDKPPSAPLSPAPLPSALDPEESEQVLDTELSTTSSKASITSKSSTSSRSPEQHLSTPSRAPYARPSTPSRGLRRPSTPSRGLPRSSTPARSPTSSSTRKVSGTKIPVPDHLAHTPARPGSPMLSSSTPRTRTTSHTSTSHASVSGGIARPRIPSGWRPQSPPA
jgi:hypothetical protein